MEVAFKIIAHNSAVWKAAVALREAKLRKPLGTTFKAHELAEERDHHPIIGMLANEVVATAVLVPEEGAINMQRVAVSETLRNAAIGSRMMAFCESYAVEKGFGTMYCHARDLAVRSYLKNRYTEIGDYFEEDGIPHVKLTKVLADR